MTLWQRTTAWVQAKGGALHCLVLVYVAGLFWFKGSPAFHEVCVQLWNRLPSLLQTSLEAVQQIAALYGVGSIVKVTGARAMAKFNAKGDEHA